MVDQEYYRRRAEEELRAAERAADPAISQIHREMAERYRDMVGQSGGIDGAGGLAHEPQQQTAAG